MMNDHIKRKKKVDGKVIFVSKKFMNTVDILKIKKGYTTRVDYLDDLADQLQASYENKEQVNSNGKKRSFFDMEW